MRMLGFFPLLLACAPAMAQQTGTSGSAQPSDPPQITTSARGEARARPDRATVVIAVQTRATTASQAATDNATRTEAVLAALRRLGLTNEQLSTIEYSVHPQIRYSQQGEEMGITAYIVRNAIRADLQRIEQVGPVLDSALGAGANSINSLTFHSSNVEQVRREAIAAAMSNARADAEVLARAAGGTLGRLLEAHTGEVVIPLLRSSVTRMAAEMAAPTPIQPGEQEITANVTARWEFVPGR
ncbi:MAG TPA: SIMPL domain-containing protein [Gemmatimonadaceae bacterium]|nr:SIMPL domain-containing protein [Gemmatimonadaceae bacterium]